jgi:hypothetical protein
LDLSEIKRRLTDSWSPSGAPINVGVLSYVETELGVGLPADYKSLMLWSNGGEVLRPFRYFRFYRAAELIRLREEGHPPDALEFSTDESNGFAFDLTSNKDTCRYPILRYPLGETTRDEVECVGDDILSFIARHVLRPRRPA